MWAVRAIFSPAGRVVLTLLAFVAWTAYQRHDAATTEMDRLTAQFERDKAAEVERQAAVSRAALSAANKRADLAEAKVAELRDAADAIKADLDANGNQCPLDGPLRDRLRAIR